MYVVPVAINYDRVLEDRSLLREMETLTRGARRPSRLTQIYEVLRYAGWNALRLVTRRWKRYGRAALVIGEPWPLAAWLSELEAQGVRLFEMERHERLGHVQAFADRVMQRIGAIMPVTPVALACAALESFDAEYIARDQLLERMTELRDVLRVLHAHVVRHDAEIAETFDRAYRMLRMRRVIARQGTGYFVLPKGRQLIGFYASSIRHLLGPYASAVHERDALRSQRVIAQ
jgi:glycerol-3-phosphate O-acyltransferase